MQGLDWNKFFANFDWNSIVNNAEAAASQAVDMIVNDLVVPQVDPHPKGDGHGALLGSFSDALDWEKLERRTISYSAGSYGVGSMAPKTVVVYRDGAVYTTLDANAFAPNAQQFRFTGWLDAGGNAYSNGQFIPVNGNMVLTAQWDSNRVVQYEVEPTGGLTGSIPNSDYGLYVDGYIQYQPGTFEEAGKFYQLPYGKKIGLVCGGNLRTPDIRVNGWSVGFPGSDLTAGKIIAEVEITAYTMVTFKLSYERLTGKYCWDCDVTIYN